jgi:hypothetical protein
MGRPEILEVIAANRVAGSSLPASADHNVNVFDALGFPPAEADYLAVRADLMIALKWATAGQGFTAEATVRRCGVSPAVIKAILRGRIDLLDRATLQGVAGILKIE